MQYTCLCPVLEKMDEEARRLVAINAEGKICIGRLECPLHHNLLNAENYDDDYYPGYGVNLNEQ